MSENTKKAGYKISEWVDEFTFSRATVWRLIAQNKLPIAKVGGRTVILQSPADFLAAHQVQA